MPCSLYIYSDSAYCIFHLHWHCHSCLCCRDVVAIELLWLRDSLIFWMGGLIVKSIRCSEWCFTSHTAVLKIAVIVGSNLESIRVWDVDGRNLFGGGNSTPVDSSSQRKWRRGGYHGCGSKHWRWVREWCVVCAKSYLVKSLPAMDAHERPLFIELRGTVVSCQIFIRSQSLIARWARNDLILAAVARDLYEACRINDVSRGSKLYPFWAS